MTADSINSMPFGQLGIIALESCRDIGNKIDYCLRKRREDVSGENVDTFLVPTEEIRFSNGEGKVRLDGTVRGKDIYILCDIGNYSCTYEMFGFTNHKGPDEHFQDIKRVVSAIGGKARRVSVIMPLIYEGRQHKRKGRDPLIVPWPFRNLKGLE